MSGISKSLGAEEINDCQECGMWGVWCVGSEFMGTGCLFRGEEEVLKLIVVMVMQLSDYTINH